MKKVNVGERIKKRREELHLTADELGELVGKNRATIYRYEKNEIENLPYNIIEKLAKVLRVSPAYLMGWDDNLEIPNKQSEYPYYPVSVSAGMPLCIDSVDEAETIFVHDEILGKYAGRKDIFFMRVNGDSMNKIFPHNTLIAVKRIEQHELKNGDIVVFSNGSDYAVKRFYRTGNKLIFRPESTIPTFTDYIVDDNTIEEIRIHGKVITYIVNLD